MRESKVVSAVILLLVLLVGTSSRCDAQATERLPLINDPLLTKALKFLELESYNRDIYRPSPKTREVPFICGANTSANYVSPPSFRQMFLALNVTGPLNGQYTGFTHDMHVKGKATDPPTVEPFVEFVFEINSSSSDLDRFNPCIFFRKLDNKFTSVSNRKWHLLGWNSGKRFFPAGQNATPPNPPYTTVYAISIFDVLQGQALTDLQSLLTNPREDTVFRKAVIRKLSLFQQAILSVVDDGSVEHFYIGNGRFNQQDAFGPNVSIPITNQCPFSQ